MVSPIPKAVHDIWKTWNIRGVILLSLALQTFLIVFAPLRKRTHRSLVVWSIWSAYLFADWAANFCIGLISNISDSDTPSASTNNLMAFWAPFLLLHLGGPDTITAFSLEDNELWLRHLLGLIFQAVAAAYVFLLTLPANPLWIPTVLMFVAGLIKYAERTRALYLASMSAFRGSIVQDPDPGPNYAKLMEEQHSRTQAGFPAWIHIMPEPDRKTKSNLPEIERDPRERESHVEMVNEAFEFFDKYRGLIVDVIFSLGDAKELRRKFSKRTSQDALRLIEIELNYIYEVFYTKVLVVRNAWGCFFRFLCFASTLVALVFFIYQHKLHGFQKFDVTVTYTLLCGALALDSIALLLLTFSDRTVVVSSRESQKKFAFLENFLNWKKPTWSRCKKEPFTEFEALSTFFMFRRWSGTISGYNLIDYCLRQCSSRNPHWDSRESIFVKAIKYFWQILKSAFVKIVDYFGAKDLIEAWLHKENNPFLKKLWEFIVEELKRKSENADSVEDVQAICSARGEWVVQDYLTDSESIEKLMPFVASDQVTFDESLLLWHVATHLCYATESDDEDENDNDDKRVFSKLVSDYMLYLLVMQPTMMSAVAGIGPIRFQDTCAEAIKFFGKMEHLEVESTDHEDHHKKENKKERVKKEACRKLCSVPTEVKPVDVKGDRSKSLLFEACRLAKTLKTFQRNQKWEIISKVWVEMLSFAACNCRPTTFVQQLSKGGELISIVWLLMIHLGLGKQFQIKEGHARAKLIVGK